MMEKTLKAFCFVFVFIFSLSGAVPAQPAEPVKMPFCPVMTGKRVKKKFYVDHDGKRIYLCCRSCVKAFRKHPEKYRKSRGNQIGTQTYQIET